jgi:hypothetical protein
MSSSYSFLDIGASLIGPGGAISLGNGAAVAEEGISFTPTGDRSAMTVGADGKGMHSLFADKSGTVTVRLLKNSPVNTQLSRMFNFQTASGATHGQNTITLNDKSRGDIVAATQVAFKKMPDLTYAKQADIVEWIFDAVVIDFNLGS